MPKNFDKIFFFAKFFDQISIFLPLIFWQKSRFFKENITKTNTKISIFRNMFSLFDSLLATKGA